MHRLLAVAALLAVSAAPAAAQAPNAPQPTIEQRMLLRCSAAFALVAAEQGRGVESALGYPPLHVRGREYMARTGAALIDKLGLTREQVAELFQREAAKLQDEAARADNPAELLDRVMQPCLLSLAASGL